MLAAKAEQIRLYHDIGREISERQLQQGWGAKVIDRQSADLRADFPNMKGLSASNLKYMRFFAQECPDRLFGQQSADQLPWFHIVTLVTKLPDPALREWYAREAIAQSWLRDTLTLQIKNQLHLRQGAAVTNFDKRLASPQAGLATQILKDPYHFDFLGLGDEAHERDIKGALIRHITRFLLELGAGVEPEQACVQPRPCPCMRRPHDHHRSVRAGRNTTTSAIAKTGTDQDRHVMSTPKLGTPALAADWSSTGSDAAWLKPHGERPKPSIDHVAARKWSKKMPPSCRWAALSAHPARHAYAPNSSAGALSP